MNEQADAWTLGELRWDAYFGVVLIASVIIAQIAGQASEPGRLLASTGLAAMVPWYLLVGGPPPEALSARETEVLALVARGLTNVQIGRALFVSEATVKTHLTRACTKLGVAGRTAAVTKAMEIGALPPPGRPG